MFTTKFTKGAKNEQKPFVKKFASGGHVDTEEQVNCVMKGSRGEREDTGIGFKDESRYGGADLPTSGIGSNEYEYRMKRHDRPFEKKRTPLLR